MRYANDLIPYIRLPLRLNSLFLSAWKETPNSDVIFTDSLTSAIRFCTFCRMNRYLERLSLPHTQSFAAARQIACRIRTYGITSVYMLFHVCRITHNACRLRLGVIHNCHHFHERTQRTLGGGGQGRPYACLNVVFKWRFLNVVMEIRK